MTHSPNENVSKMDGAKGKFQSLLELILNYRRERIHINIR